MLTVVMLNVVLLNVVMLNVVMPYVVMLIVVILSVVAPQPQILALHVNESMWIPLPVRLLRVKKFHYIDYRRNSYKLRTSHIRLGFTCDISIRTLDLYGKTNKFLIISIVILTVVVLGVAFFIVLLSVILLRHYHTQQNDIHHNDTQHNHYENITLVINETA
jgi:hypothetical protein